MKAIGARRRDIRRLYLRTTLLFGALGALVGSGLGILLANGLVKYFANLGFGISAGWGVSVPIVIACVIAGLIAPPLAALPAVRSRGSNAAGVALAWRWCREDDAPVV